MKNKVLRLAIVAVLVVAMVLSMAACNDPKPVDPTPVVTPTPTKTPDKTVAPSTPAPTKTPDVSTDEATLEAKYGITFPVAEDMKVSFKDTSKDLQVVGADGKKIPFGAKAPAYNDAYNAYKGVITVSAKVNGLTAEGNKITVNDLTKADGGKLAETDWAYYLPTAAGTYTVVYTVKVAYPGEATFGGYKPAKVAETYSVTKVYEVAKKAITIESVSDAHKKVDKLEYPAATLKVGSLEEVQKKLVLEELKLDGAEKKFDLSIDIVSADLTAYGTYPLTLVCLDGKKQKVDLATLVAPDFEVTFKNGNRYVLTDAELAAAVAAQDDVDAANAGVKKEDIELGVATYAALSDASKTWFLQTNKPASDKNIANANLVIGMSKNNKNLSRNGMVEEALKLAKTWNDKLQNAEDGKAFVTYMLSLSKTPVVFELDGSHDTDYDFVKTKLEAAVTADATGKAYITTALALITTYEKTVLTNFAAKFNDAVNAADFSKKANTGLDNFFDKATFENFAKKVAAAQVAYDALVAGQEKYTITEANAIIDGTGTTGDIGEGTVPNLVDATKSVKANFAKLSKVSSEATARYTAYATLVDGLDAYTGDKATKDQMIKLLGYSFDNKMINYLHEDVKVGAGKDEKVIHAGESEASFVLFNYNPAGDYVVFATPMLFVENATKSYKTLVDAFVALDSAIVSAQKDVITNLGSKIALAVDKTIMCDSFTGAKFVFKAGEAASTNPKDITRLEALQAYIAQEAIKYVMGTEYPRVPFADLAKKELSVVIAAALKDPVAAVNDYIKGEDAFLFTIVGKKASEFTGSDTTLTFQLENFPVGLTANTDVVVTLLRKSAKPETLVKSTSVATTANVATTQLVATFGATISSAVAEGDIITVTYNGRTITVTAGANA